MVNINSIFFFLLETISKFCFGLKINKIPSWKCSRDAWIHTNIVRESLEVWSSTWIFPPDQRGYFLVFIPHTSTLMSSPAAKERFSGKSSSTGGKTTKRSKKEMVEIKWITSTTRDISRSFYSKQIEQTNKREKLK